MQRNCLMGGSNGYVNQCFMQNNGVRNFFKFELRYLFCILAALFLMTSRPACSQLANIHSLDISMDDRIQMEYLDSISNSDFQKSLDYCFIEIKKIAFSDSPRRYSALLAKANMAAYHLGNLKLADSLFQSILEIPIESFHPLVKAELLSSKFYITNFYGYSIRALEYANEGYVIYQQEEDLVGQAKQISKLIRVNLLLENNSMLSNYETKINKLISGCDDTKLIVSIYLQCSRINIKTEEYDKALQYLLLAKDLAQKIGDVDLHARTLFFLGRFYYHQKNYSKAYHILAEALRQFNLSNNKLCASHVTTFMASVYMNQNKNNLALEYNKKACFLRKQVGSIYLMGSSYFNIANCYIHLRQYDSASYYVFLGENTLNKYPCQLYITRGQELRKEISLLRKDYKSAYYSLKDIIRVSDSIYKQNNEQKLEQFESSIEFGKYMQQKNEIGAETKLLRNIEERNMVLTRMLLIVIILAIIAAYLYSLFSKERSRRSLIRISQKMIFIQMNSHFVFNALTAIQSLIFKKQIDEAIRSLTMFSSLMNKTLSITHEKYINLNMEISFMMEFMQLQQLRFGDDLKFLVNVSPKIDLKKAKVPPMLIYPYLEYASEECVQGSANDHRIEINIYEEGSFIIYEIIDIGLGFSDKKRCYIKRYGGQEIICDHLTNERVSIYNNLFNTRLIFARLKKERDGQLCNALQFKIKR